MKNYLYLIPTLLTFTANGQTYLNDYIQIGLKSNESIRQEQFVLDKSMLALEEAKALFFPTVSLNAVYTKSEGGRNVNLPLGDLLNPVYRTLNQLTGSNSFPELNNQEIFFNPDNFYDAKIHATLPLVNAEVYYNGKIRREFVNLQTLQLQLYKRELIKDIKVAFFRVWQASQGVKIYQNALAVSEEGERISQALLNNGKSNRTAFHRASNEVTKIKAALNESQQNFVNAKHYFNFLINRDLEEQIVLDDLVLNAGENLFTLPEDTTISRREELSKVTSAVQISSNSARLANSHYVPRVGLFMDFGYQGFDWQFDNDSRYYFAGISLEWTLFSFGRNRLRSQQTSIDLQWMKLERDQVADRLRLELLVLINNYKAAKMNFEASISSAKNAAEYHGDILRLYKEGKALYIELLDAQNVLVDAQLQESISRTNVLIKLAELERSTSSYNLNEH